VRADIERDQSLEVEISTSMARVHPSEAPPTGAHVQQQHAQPAVHSANQTAEFFLANYRLGKTLGIGSFGKVGVLAGTPYSFIDAAHSTPVERG